MAAQPRTMPASHAAGLPRDALRFGRAQQLQAATIGAAFIGVFWYLFDFIPPNLGSLVSAWVNDEDWSHGPLIPLFSAYLVYLRWDQIRRCPVTYTSVGLVVLVVGLGLYVWTLSGLLLFGYARSMAMMVCLLGVVIFLCGLPVVRHVGLPWAYLFFALPLPGSVYFRLTDPLRRMAASVVEVVLRGMPGLSIERVGSNLEYAYRGVTGVIGVADACSGMRSTVTLCALGVAVAFMTERPLWQRLVLIGVCVPIATFCNFIRVTTTSWLYIFVDPKYASGMYHKMLGLLVILIAFGIFSGIGWILDHLFVEDPEARSAAPELRPSGRAERTTGTT